MFEFNPQHGRRRQGAGRAADEFRARLLALGREGLKLALTLTVCTAAIWGLQRAQQNEFRNPEYHQQTQFVLADAPAGIADVVLDDLARLTQTSWIDNELCERAYERLSQSPWVRAVHHVGKAEPGVIRVACEYRRPIAMVQQHEYFYMVDEYGIRLPGQYDYQPGWLLIQGVQAALPEPGEIWPGADLAAGLRLAEMLLNQPYHYQVVAVLMHNHGGRVDPYHHHVELVTDRDGSRILWGSAPGEEQEENTAAHKLQILAENFRRHGRIDAHQPRIDISVFPDRYFIPGLEFAGG